MKIQMFENHRYVRLSMVILKHCVLLSSQTSDPPQNDKKRAKHQNKAICLGKTGHCEGQTQLQSEDKTLFPLKPDAQ